MSNIDARTINLNLLPALEALLVEGSVGGAARRMRVSQSAMSHTLARLREVFGDPLFVQHGRGLSPTPRARHLASTLPRGLQALQEALEQPAAFDPRTATRVFRIATVDYFELAMLPSLLAHLAEAAPGIRLEIDRFAPASVAPLVAGEVDLALLGASAGIPTAGLRSATLYRDPFAVIARANHPRIGRRLDLDTYLSLGHVVVSVEGRREGPVDRALEKLGLRRTIAVRVPHFVSAPLAVQQSDLISTIASSVAERARELFGLRVLEPPIELPEATVVALWPRRHDADPARRWFRDLFVSGRVAPAHIRTLMRRTQRAR